jgi:type I restriction-modification system R protein
MIEAVIQQHIQVFSKRWYVGEDELHYYVEHYRKGVKKQLGESQRYQDYKIEVADALNPLLYKKQIKEACKQLVEEVIEPLRVGNRIL